MYIQLERNSKVKNSYYRINKLVLFAKQPSTFPGEHFENQFYRQQPFALLPKTTPFYFHNAQWIYFRSGRAISLDRKFNTVVTEASIKIDENIPADGREWGTSPGDITLNCEKLPRKTSIETIRERSQRMLDIL